FEVDHISSSIGRQAMLINACELGGRNRETMRILLAIEGAPDCIRQQEEHSIADERIGILLQELTHRVKNSLQLIASIVMIEARGRQIGEGKAALERVSHRIAALGHLYSKLERTDTVETVDAAAYLNDLCRDLIASVQKVGSRGITLTTE